LPNTPTGHEAIPANTVKNPDHQEDGSGSPIFKYKRGTGGRIEFLEGIIKIGNVNGGRGSPCSPATRQYTTRMSMGVNGDICGHIIANTLGGSGREEFNVFPQNSRLNNGPWKSLERRIKEFVKNGTDNVANLRFWFDYEKPTDTRPTAFTLTVNFLVGYDIEDGTSLRVENRQY